MCRGTRCFPASWRRLPQSEHSLGFWTCISSGIPGELRSRLRNILTGKPKGVRSVVFVGPLISTPLWIEDAKSLVKLLPADTQDAIYAASASGNYDTPAFQAATKVFGQNFGVRTPMTAEQFRELLPACASTPQPFNKELYEVHVGAI